MIFHHCPKINCLWPHFNFPKPLTLELMMFEFTHGLMKGHVHTCFTHWPMTLEPFYTINAFSSCWLLYLPFYITWGNAWGIFHWSSYLLKLFQLVLIHVHHINICVCPFTYMSHEKMHGVGHFICPICHQFAKNKFSWQKHFMIRCLKSNYVIICPLYLLLIIIVITLQL